MAGIDEMKQSLLDYSTEDLLDVLQGVLRERTEALQFLVDWAVPKYVYGTAGCLLNARYRGVIKSFSEYHGYGFITSEEINEAFGKDLFVHGHQLKGFRAGDSVDFAILLNKGKPNAFDLMSLNAAPAAMKNYRPDILEEVKGKGAFGKGKGLGKGAGKIRGPAEVPVSEVEVPGLTDRRFEGTVKSFKDGKFGFLICEELEHEYGKDVYVPWKYIRGFQVDERVTFAVIMNNENKIQACDLQREGGPQKRARIAY
eukprot:TRINITY_DN50764_c0_g1_i1.p1 TRINITY_DN50764_c0_g1~~TRINITY_DN50764_c0_g1_i1.p1  ORF type:complete len:256 (-),score=54.04 TRINITY_DN50764_c0_g1_i1:34-801(-)